MDPYEAGYLFGRLFVPLCCIVVVLAAIGGVIWWAVASSRNKSP